jgi:hypothetical protein
MKYIRANISNQLLTEMFQSFVIEYLDKVKPGTETELAIMQVKYTTKLKWS